MHHRQGLFWRETQSSSNQSPQLLNVSVGSGEGGKKRGSIPAVTELPRGKHEILNTVIGLFFPSSSSNSNFLKVVGGKEEVKDGVESTVGFILDISLDAGRGGSSMAVVLQELSPGLICAL